MSPDSTATDRYRPGPHRVALAASAFTLPLLFVGGSVTSYGVGMAVPDWPSTFGINMFLYDFWHAPFGVRVEHTHRLYGAAVGLATVFLAGWFLAFERRRYMKVLGVVALAAVVAQGVLGGTRVTQVSTFLAAVHGCTGQAFFGLTVALCVLTGRKWIEAGAPTFETSGLRRQSAILLAMVYAQIVAGAWFRHYRSVPSVWVHGLGALAVLGYAGWVVHAVIRHRESVPALLPSARALTLAVTLQVVLGVVALVMILPLGGNPRVPTLWQAMTRTAHQTNGALLLGASVVLALRARRALRPVAERAPNPGRPEPSTSALEALA